MTKPKQHSDGLVLRPPRLEDGAAMWRLVEECGVLDRNSSYVYLLVADKFADTSIVAEEDGRVVGFVSGFRPPRQDDVLFVWQVAVHDSVRGRGVAGRMLRYMVEQPACDGVRYVETTVTPSNQPSRAMFASLTRALETECNESAGYEGHLFPTGNHEPERLLRIGPFRRKA